MGQFSDFRGWGRLLYLICGMDAVAQAVRGGCLSTLKGGVARGVPRRPS